MQGLRIESQNGPLLCYDCCCDKTLQVIVMNCLSILRIVVYIFLIDIHTIPNLIYHHKILVNF